MDSKQTNQSTIRLVYTHAEFAFGHGSFLQIACLRLRLTTGKMGVDYKKGEWPAIFHEEADSRLNNVEMQWIGTGLQALPCLGSESNAEALFSVIHKLLHSAIETAMPRRSFRELNIVELLTKGESTNSGTKMFLEGWGRLGYTTYECWACTGDNLSHDCPRKHNK